MRVSGHTGGRSPTLSHEKSLEATVLETEELNHRDLYVCTADDSIRTKKKLALAHLQDVCWWEGCVEAAYPGKSVL